MAGAGQDEADADWEAGFDEDDPIGTTAIPKSEE